MSKHHTPCDRLSEDAITGILSSSDLPGSVASKRTYSATPSPYRSTSRYSKHPPASSSSFLADPRTTPGSGTSVANSGYNPQYSKNTPGSSSSFLTDPRKTPGSGTINADTGYNPQYSKNIQGSSSSFQTDPGKTPGFGTSNTGYNPQYNKNTPGSSSSFLTNPRKTPSSGTSNADTGYNPQYSKNTPGSSSSFQTDPHKTPGSVTSDARKVQGYNPPYNKNTPGSSSSFQTDPRKTPGSGTSNPGRELFNRSEGIDPHQRAAPSSGPSSDNSLTVTAIIRNEQNALDRNSSSTSFDQRNIGFGRSTTVDRNASSTSVERAEYGRRTAGIASSMRSSPQAKRPCRFSSNDDTIVENEEEEEEEEHHDDSQIYLSVMWSHGQLGAAYYDLSTQQISLMLDTREGTDFHMFTRLLQEVRPHRVIVSASQDQALLELLKTINTNTSDEENETVNSEFIQIVPTLDFSYESSKRRAMMLTLPGMTEDFSEADRAIHLSALVPFQQVNVMRSFGGLLKYLDKVRVGIQLESAETSVPIMAINTVSLSDMLVMDDVSYCGLDIFKKANTPSSRISGWSNESKYSLFGILNKCRSTNGAKLLRLWCHRPTRNLRVLKERQEAIAFFKRSANIEVTSKLRTCLSGTKSLSRILPQMKKNAVCLSSWKILYRTVYNAIFIGDICGQMSNRLPVFMKITKVANTEHLQKIANHITKIADFEEFAKTRMFSVKPGVDEDLDHMKRTYNGLPDFMTLVAKEELKRLGDDILECNITYMPNIGYLLVIPETERMRRAGSYDMQNCDFRFVSNGQVYYKNESTQELDRQLGDTQSEIQDRQTSIMHQLQDIIISHSPTILSALEYLAELDCLISLAMVARENNYTCPEMTADNVLNIQGGRHPIQELVCNPFVPNDLYSGGGEHSRIKLLTGPNASGKSVYLTQVALIVFMAHIGSYVPAKSACIGVTDRIFTCIKAQETLWQNMSSFMIDINQVSVAVNCSTPRSLVLLDEFGKGTETVSGMSLLVSMLHKWIQLSDESPHTLVSTHFHNIGHDNHLPRTPILQYQSMDTMSGGDGEEELVFLYQLVDGCATCSHACHVAAIVGINPDIITRGKEVSALLRKEQSIGRVDTASTVIQDERNKRIVDKFLELDLETADIEEFLHQFVLPVNEGRI